MYWEEDDQQDQRVAESTLWNQMFTYTHLQHRAGVFVFADYANKVMYIDMAEPGRMVDSISEAISRGRYYGSTRVKVLYTMTEEGARSLKRDLIEKYEPVKNYGP